MIISDQDPDRLRALLTRFHGTLYWPLYWLLSSSHCLVAHGAHFVASLGTIARIRLTRKPG